MKPGAISATMSGVASMTIAGQRGEHEEQRSEHVLGETPRGILALALQRAGVERDEGGVEGALGEQPAEQIGEAEGGIEGVGDRPGAERAGHHHLADEAEQARGQVAPPTLTNWRTEDVTQALASAGCFVTADRSEERAADAASGAAFAAILWPTRSVT